MEELAAILQENNFKAGPIEKFEEVGTSVYLTTLFSEDVVGDWQKLKNLLSKVGYYPVITSKEKLKRNFRRPITIEQIKETIEKSLTINAEEWLEYETEDFTEDELESIHGDWPETEVLDNPNTFEFIKDLPKKLDEYQVGIVLVPTTLSWQVPIYLNLGDWNSCPEPETHGAILKYWQEKYSAEIVFMTFDTIELIVAKPPQDRETAMQLALVQYAYCDDIVGQGVGSIENLASILLNGTVWFFWWD